MNHTLRFIRSRLEALQLNVHHEKIGLKKWMLMSISVSMIPIQPKQPTECFNNWFDMTYRLSECPVEHIKRRITYRRDGSNMVERCMCWCHEHAKPWPPEKESKVGIAALKDVKWLDSALALINDVNKYRTELETNGVFVNDALSIIQSKTDGKGEEKQLSRYQGSERHWRYVRSRTRGTGRRTNKDYLPVSSSLESCDLNEWFVGVGCP